ncbi:MAG: PAS domain-containing protein, partial [Alphaproteobacteria bacterium]|nr:PAS domain-containing protein [Alphaproteobacteria bacterium]
MKLAQFHPDIVPMQYNTAVTMGMMAVSLLAALFYPQSPRARIISMLTAVLVFVMTMATGLQYIVGLDFGIDNALFDSRHHAQAQTAYPGRMAPNTVICFILLSVGIFIAQKTAIQEARHNITILVALLVATFSGVALAGYVLDIEAAYGWWSLSNIAPQTACLLFLQAISMTGLVLSCSSREIESNIGRHLQISWRPMLAAIVGITITLAVAQSILEQARTRMVMKAEYEASRVMNMLQVVIEEKIENLERMAARWKIANRTPINYWENDASYYLAHNSSYGSLALMDRDFQIYRFMPDSPDIKTFWDHLVPEQERLNAAAAQDKSIIMRFSKTGPHKNTLLMYVPLFVAEGHDGFLAKSYNPAVTLRALLNGKEYHYEISDDFGILARNYESTEDFIWEVRHDIPINIHGRDFVISAMMNAKEYESGGLVFLIVISGLVMSILLANTLYKAARLRRYTELLQESEHKYALTVEGVCLALWDWDEPANVVKWGGQAWQLLGYENNDEVPSTSTEVRALIPDDDNENVSQAILAAVNNDGRFEAEFRMRLPNGDLKWVQSVGRAVDYNEKGQAVRMVGIMQDIHARKVAEFLLKRTNEELEQFAYIASHDLKAPLRGIDNLAKWIAEDLRDVLTEDVREKFDLLRGRVARLEMLLQDILQYSRAGRVVDNIVQIDTAKMLQQIADSIVLAPDFELRIDSD